MKALLERDLKHIRSCAWIAIFLLLSAGLLFAQLQEEQSATPPPPDQQSQQQQAQNRIRALAVVEVRGASGNLAAAKIARVDPVLILYKGKYQDAGLYEASPVPMALYQGTVYEVERSGEAAGLITLQQAHEQRESWFASASWVQKTTKTVAAKTRNSEDEFDQRPTLKRPTSESSSPQPASSAPQNSSPSASAPQNNAEPPAVTQAASGVVHHEAAEPPQDPNRPVLRRGKPEEEQAAEIPEPAAAPAKGATPSAAVTQSPPGSSTSSGALRDYVAISDPGAYDTRPLAYAWTAQEKEDWSKQLGKIAMRKLLAYAESKGLAAKSGDTMQADDVRAFDLFNNNDAQLVMTAHQHFDRAIAHKQRVSSLPTSVDAYVTLIAYRDLDGNMNEIFSTVTDNQRLDVEGRLQLIDAVDANADGHGELLFRRIGADSDRFELYRIGATQMYKLFEGSDFSR